MQNVNNNTFTGALKDIKQPGVYNVTMDIKGMNKEGQPYSRTIVKSVYVEVRKNEKKYRTFVVEEFGTFSCL